MVDQGNPDKHAPGDLFLVQRFVNSVEFDVPQDELSTPEALRGWFAERDLMRPDEPVTEGDLRRALDVREGLRALLFANNGDDVDEPALERLNRAAGRACLVLRADGGSPRLESEAVGVDGALAQVLSRVSTAVADGTWERLKACALDDCRWAFYDHSKNRSGKWCSMETCGNVHKARRHRAKQRGQAAA